MTKKAERRSPDTNGGNGKAAMRPHPDRTQPIRNWSGVYGSDATGPRSAEGRAPSTETPETASSSVAAGYRVIDEYLRQGQSAARAFWAPAFRGGSDAHEDLPDDVDDAAGPVGPDVSQAASRLLRGLGELGTTWLELVQALARAPVFDPPADRDTAGPFRVGRAAPRSSDSEDGRGDAQSHAARAPTVVVSVAAPRPVEAKVDIGLVPADTALSVTPLVDAAGDLVPINSVTAEVDGSTLRVRAVVGDEQPPGTYHGVLLAAGAACGTLTLDVS